MINWPSLCWRLSLLTVLLLLACGKQEDKPAGEAHSQPGIVLRDLPAEIRPQARYLFYLHGAIVEDKGLRPEHPTFGVYEYEAILDTLAARGLVVISEARKPGTNVYVYARKVMVQIDGLLAAGVLPDHISVGGHSKGGAIAIRVCSMLQNERMNFIFLASCFAGTFTPPGPDLCGRVLSIYEASDELAGSCQRAFDMATRPLIYHEIELQTGEGHGAFYRPIPEWIDPLVEWAAGETPKNIED
jgi:hypothetical protein